MEQLFSIGAEPAPFSVCSEPCRSQNKEETRPGNLVLLPYPIVPSCFQKSLWYPCLTSSRGLQSAVAGQMISTQHLTGQGSQANRKACWAWTPQDAGSSSASLYSSLWVLLRASTCRKGPWGPCSCAQLLFHPPFLGPRGQLSLQLLMAGLTGPLPPVPDSFPLKITY